MAIVSKNVHQWFKKSYDNLKLAQGILGLDEKFYEHVCFNSQQSVEKALKGYLTFKKIRFDKTHDIAILVTLVRSVDPDLANKLLPADQLTEFAVRIRYPEESGEQINVDKALAEKSIQLAKGAYDLLFSILN